MVKLKNFMKVCLIGNNLTSLILAKILSKKNFKVEILYLKDPKYNFKTRSLGISKYNLNYLDNYFKNISKITKPIDQINVFIKNDKINDQIFFSNKPNILFSMVKYDQLISFIKTRLKRNKNILFKNIKKQSDLLFLRKRKDYKLIINCENNNVLTKKFLKRVTDKEYLNRAFTTIIKHKKFKNNIAFQIFTEKGPLAFLPLSDQMTSIVYSIEEKKNKVSDKEVINLINHYNAFYKITSLEKFQTFYLSFKLAKNYFNKNILFLGDSIHSIHPLAGQGFNMTIRDIINLDLIIEKKIDLGLNIDENIYKEFENNTKSFNSIFSHGIDFIYEFFRFNKNFIPSKISEKMFLFLRKNKKIKDLSIRFADKGINSY